MNRWKRISRSDMASWSGPIERMLILLAAALCIYVLWVWATRSVDAASLDASALWRQEALQRRDQPEPVASALERVSQRNIFSPPRPEGFQGRVVGILGDEVFFEGARTARVGDEFQGAKILAIGPDWVEIEFEGKEQRIAVFDGRGGGDRPSAGERRGRGGRPPGRFMRRRN